MSEQVNSLTYEGGLESWLISFRYNDVNERCPSSLWRQGGVLVLTITTFPLLHGKSRLQFQPIKL